MRVLISSVRLTGHIRPLILYAHALLERGHEVVFSTPDSAAGMVRDAGLVHAKADFPAEKDLEKPFAALAKMSDEEKMHKVVTNFFAGRYARTALPSLRRTIASFKPDLIVRESMEFASVIAAAETGIPVIRVATSNGKMEEHVLSTAIAPMDQMRKDAGLAPDQGAAMFATPSFTAFPHSFETDDQNTDMPKPFHVGSPRQAVPEGGPIPDWADTGGLPLIFVTLGTLAGVSSKTPKLMRTVLDGISTLPVRALLSTGADMRLDQLGAVPENVTVVPWVPQEEIFPRADALLCHGGAGTIIAGMANGVPMVITPLAADQPENARRIEALGCGIALPKPDMASVHSALERTLSDARLRAAANGVAEEIAALPGISDAIQEFEHLAGHHP